MKKAILFLIILSNSIISSDRLEARGGIGFMVGQPSGITFRYNNFPVLTVGYSFFTGEQWINGSLDYWFLNNPIKGQFKYYVGIGGNLGIYTDSNTPIRLGARVPVGLQWIPAELIEVFIEAAPGFRILPSPDFDIQAGLGIRFLIFK
jgi:hypothetical protein